MQSLNLILLSSILMQAALSSKLLLRVRLDKKWSNVLVCIISMVLLLHLINIYSYHFSHLPIPFHILPVAIVSYGPLVYAYVISLTCSRSSLPRHIRYTFVPVVFIAVIHIIGHDDYYSWHHIAFHLFIYAYSLVFLLMAIYRVYTNLARGKHELSWVYHFVLLVAFLIVFIALDYARFITSWQGLKNFTAEAIVWVGFVIALGSLLRSQLYPSIFDRKKSTLSTSRKLPYSASEVLQMIQNLEAYMSASKPYLIHDLTIRELGEKLDIPAHVISQLINSHFQKNFLEYINTYRINEAKQLLKKSDLKILAVALESGFSNKTSFNRTFKKFTGLAPSAFRNGSSFEAEQAIASNRLSDD